MIASLILVFVLPAALHAGDIKQLFKQVEELNIQRHGYTLGKELDSGQLEIASAHPQKATLPETFKFQDEGMFIVAQKNTNRVLVLYESRDNASQKNVQDLIGDLYMSFEDPTVLAHDKVVYWAFTGKGKVSSEKFDTAKEDKKRLDIIATVKFVSDIKIMEKQQQDLSGYVYYIISSDPILKLLGASNSYAEIP